MSEETIQQIGRLSLENGRMRSLISQAIANMEHAEIFITSKEMMHPDGRQQWHYLIGRMQAVIDAGSAK